MPGATETRVEYPGAMYHVMSRGDRREDIFLDDVDRHDYLKTLAEACQKTGWQVHAYCLMRNHYHLVLETPNANLVAGSIAKKVKVGSHAGQDPEAPIRTKSVEPISAWVDQHLSHGKRPCNHYLDR